MVGLRQAVILVGGRGTRLGALAANTHKPLLPIAGEICCLDTLIENIARHGFIDIILLAGHLGDAFEKRYAGATLRGARIRVIREAQPLGTGGALLGAKAYLDGSPRACTSRLWPHTERIKANCSRFERTRDMQAAAACVAAFEALMSHTKVAPPGLWRDRRRADGSFVDEPAPASSFYHAALALSELIRVAG